MDRNYSLQTGEVEHFDRIISPSSSPLFFRETFETISAPRCFGRERIRNQILKNLSTEIFQSLAPQMEKVSLEKGQAICNADDEISFVYFPETAVIAEFQILPDGKTAGTSMIGSEGMHGVSALLGSRSANNWAQALTAGTTFKIAANILLEYFDQSGIVRKNILKYLNFYLEQISQKAICSNHHQISERLCGWILMLDDRGQNHSLPLSLTHEQIAFFLGAQRPSITVITQTLREKGMIDYRRGKFSIINRQALESAACSCYRAAKTTLVQDV